MRIYERYLSPDEARFMRANYGERAIEWPQLMADLRHGVEARSRVGSCGASHDVRRFGTAGPQRFSMRRT